MTYKIHGFILLLLLALNTNTLAREITVGFGEGKPPYVMHQKHSMHPHVNGVHMHGIEIDIFSTALKLMGHTLKTKVMPKSKLKRALRKDKNMDAVSAVNLSKDKFHYSDQLITFIDFAVTKDSNNISLNSVADLAPYTISTWPGAYTVLGKEFAKLYGKKGTHRHKYTQFSNQLLQNKAFWSNKIEIMILDRYIFAYYKKMLADEFATSQKLRFDDIFDGEVVYHAAFKDSALRDQFNDTLAIMRYDGTYQKIIDSYTE